MDNFKVIYKILRELEKNMGNEDFNIEAASAEKTELPFEKWEQLLILIQDDGYIKGLVLLEDIESAYRHVADPVKPQITIKGLEYLASNSMMEKVEDALRAEGEII